jgi:hypothetical protein
MTQRLTTLFFCLHIFFISWSSVLRISDWAPLPLVLLLMTVLFLFGGCLVRFSSGKPVPLALYPFDWLIIIGLCLMATSVIFLPTAKGGNYLLAYVVVFGSYLLLLMFGSRALDVGMILRANYYGINFVCVFIVLEVIGRMVTGNNIFEWIPRTREATAIVTVGMSRAYGLSTEPTQIGNYFCSFFPFAVYYASRYTQFNIKIYIFLLFFASLFTFSAAMFVVGISSLCLYFILVKEKADFLRNSLWVLCAVAVVIVFLVSYLGLIDILLGALSTVTDKVSLEPTGKSSSSRLRLLEAGLNDIANSPLFGVGLGAASSKGLNSNINWYVFLGVEAGLIILSCYVFWFGIHFCHAYINFIKTKNHIYLVCAVSIFGSMAYLVFVSTFQNLYLLSAILVYRLTLASSLNLRRKNGEC